MGCLASLQRFLETLETTALEALWSHAAKILLLLLLLGFLFLEFLVLFGCKARGDVPIEARRRPRERGLSLEGLGSFHGKAKGHESCDTERSHCRMG